VSDLEPSEREITIPIKEVARLTARSRRWVFLHIDPNVPGPRGPNGKRSAIPASELKRISETGYQRWRLEQEREAAKRIAKLGIPVEAPRSAKGLKFLTLLQIEKKFGEAKIAELNQEACWLEEVKELTAQARVQALASKGIKKGKFRQMYHRLQLYGLPGLLPPISAQKGKTKVDSNVAAFVQDCHLRRKHASVTRVCELTERFAKEKGLQAPSLSTVRRLIKRVPDSVSTYHRRGPNEYSKTHAPMVRRERVSEPALWICGDHNLMDQQLWNTCKRSLGGEFETAKDRPWVTCLMDLYNNDPVAVVLSWQGNSDTICLALRRCVLGRTGIFRFLYVDRGDDFNSARVEAACREMGITIVPAQGYHPQAKGTLEQFFGFLNERIADELNGFGYVGNRPSNRPANVTPILDLQGLENIVNFWIESYYRDRRSPALGNKSPNELYSEAVARSFVPKIPNPRTLDLLLTSSTLRKVYRDGVKIGGFTYWHESLVGLVNNRTETGENEMVEARIDPGAMGYAYIFDREGNYLCTALNEPLAKWGATKEDLKRAAEKKKSANEFIQEYAEVLRVAHSGNAIIEETILDRMAREERPILAQAVNQGGGAVVQSMIPKFDKARRAITRGDSTSHHQQVPKPEVVDWEPLDENGIRVCSEQWRMRKRYSQARKMGVIPEKYFDFDRPLREQVFRDEELSVLPEQIKDKFRDLRLFED